jgi:hypothetical protein
VSQSLGWTWYEGSNWEQNTLDLFALADEVSQKIGKK